VCPACKGQGRQSTVTPTAPTNEPIAHPPALTEKLNRYRRAIQRWIAAGRPVRSDAEVDHIFEKYCKQCRWFRRPRKRRRRQRSKPIVSGGCKLCGCRLARDGHALRNKIRMATESCPAKRPKWRAAVVISEDSEKTP